MPGYIPMGHFTPKAKDLTMDKELLKSISDAISPLQSAVWTMTRRLEKVGEMQLLASLYSPIEVRNLYGDLERLSAADASALKALNAHGDEMRSKYGDDLSTREKIEKWGGEYEAGRIEMARLFEVKKQTSEDFDRFRNEHPLIGAAGDVIKNLRG